MEYSRLSNGIYLFATEKPTIEIECDSSMEGGGGCSAPFCYTWPYTKSHRAAFPNIHHLEAVNIIVAYQTLSKPWNIEPAKVVIYTDNMASAWALSTGKTRDETLGACSRQLWLLAAVHSHEIVISHKPGHEIPTADALSRFAQDGKKRDFVKRIAREKGLTFVDPVINNYVFFNPFL